MMLFAIFAFANRTALADLDLGIVNQDWGKPMKNLSVDGNPLSVGGQKFDVGLGTHASSSFFIELGKQGQRFTAMVGIDDETKGKGSVEFHVWLDGKRKWSSGVMRGGDNPKSVDVDLSGAELLWLYVDPADNGIDYDHANWANATIVTSDGYFPRAVASPTEPDMPIFMGEKAEPEIHGARIVGCSPGKPFLYRIPATGQGISRYEVKRLPKGLDYDAKSGVILGAVATPGETVCKITVKGAKGTAKRDLRIVCGEHKLALTPPMGWNSWNVWGTSVDAAKIRDAAESFVKSGLSNYGYQYINIDDAWEAGRSKDGSIQTNEKFGDMKKLADDVHALGLKLGIYSSPGPKTCAGYEGSYQHELQDAMTWAAWGIDYLKHDWCSYGGIAKDSSKAELQKPYRVMREALDGAPRDIVYSLCQYGMGEVWNWGKEVGGNLWRTTGDITDTWGSMSGIGFSQSDMASGASPGAWNDPDMLVVGQLGWSSNPRPTRLTKNEQITHITLWAMCAAPLLIGCDLTKIDPFTKAVLCNSDVIDIDQDPLGKAGSRKWKNGTLEVWTRPLYDGMTAVALFNRGPFKSELKVDWKDIGLGTNQMVTDCWQRRYAGVITGSLKRTVPGHGAMLFRVGAKP